MVMGEERTTGSATNAARVSKNIHRLIAERGTTKSEVRRSTGLAESTFYDKLKNRPGKLTVEELTVIAMELGVEVEALWAV